jgi:hypothetical protein
MPGVASLAEFRRAVAEFPVTDLPLMIEPAARWAPFLPNASAG